MEPGVKTKRLRIDGMTCASCQNKIERKLLGTAGVERAEVSYSEGTAAVTYDTDIISLKNIVAVIEKLDYRVLAGDERRQADISRVAAILVIIVSLYVLLQQFGILNLLVPSQLADAKMGYGMLFVIGLITSVHCIAMCGGINLSQSIPRGEALAAKTTRFAAFTPTLLYNLGRVASYTAIGFILGFAGLIFGGGADAGLPTMLQGILKLIAGAFMVVMGINMLGLFPQLRKLNPGMPKIFSRKVGASAARSKSPLFVGLLNGLMPCGPLQSMQIVALASGNPLAGALSMFLFSLGTVPLMLGLGSAVSALGKKFTQKVMSVGAVLVVVMGLAMLSQGGSLSGFLPPDLLLPVILALGALGVVSSLPFRKPSHRTISTVAALGVAVLA
ncbi:MAG: sulfite exporter TauE/SafE family protein, partial [Gracilibacteraceae bacterium]|nr:sulfite exporter TauE/SafE family protein [Gracilibacteraceae bacterium]